MNSSNKNRGFTMVELITVLIIVGIIAAVALPKFFERGTYDSREFYDQVKATLRHAQKIAIAQRRFVCVAIAVNGVTLTYGATATCGSALTSAEGKSPYIVTSPTTDVTLNGAGFYFDALGRASAGSIITVSGYSPSITVEQETGYVH
jgi:MSHA pilin protein MshC